MKPDETKKFLKLLGGLFPSHVSVDQGKLLVDELADLSYEAVEKAVRNHRVHHEFLSIPKLVEGCRAAQHEAETCSNTSSHEGSWCDVYRRQAPYLSGACDLEVILRVHRSWWFSPKCNQNESYQRQFRNSCLMHILSLQIFNQEQAKTWTETIFDPDPSYFQQVLYDLRANLPAKSCA